MKNFEYINAKNLEHAVNVLQTYGRDCRVLAGGSDLVGALKDGIWGQAPACILNIKPLATLKGITLENGRLRIGALTTLTELLQSELVRQHCPMLVQAAQHTASPLLRNLGTVGGNLCQENRCWYYRYPARLGECINCARKGGKICYAVPGEHQFHSIFGAINKCIAVNPSDLAPALSALDATVHTSQRDLPIAAFFSGELGVQSTVLAQDELLLAITVPVVESEMVGAFRKLALRGSIDFAMVNGAVLVTMQAGVVCGARVWVNGVYGIPKQAKATEKLLLGSVLSLELARAAGELAADGARPLPRNRYKANLVQALVEDVLLDCL